MAYQPGIPTGSVPLNQDYLNIQGNFTSLNNQWLVDHVPLTDTSGTPPNGYHTAIHLVPQSPPAVVNGYGELYCQTTNDGINTGQQLFWQWQKSGPTTINVPLTRNFAPVASANGYTFLPGGLIIQWGITNTPGNVTTFPQPFSGSGFQPVATVSYVNLGGGAVSTPPLTIRTLNNTTLFVGIPAGTQVAYSWIVIGQ